MTAQHVRATQRRRREFTNQLDYEILLVIATDTGNGNEPAETSYRGMAERVNCHYNTVPGHIDNLVNRGLVEVVKSGKYHHYRLTYDCGVGTCDNQTEIVTTSYDNQQESTQRLSQLEQRLSQLEQRLSQALSQIEHLIITGSQTDNVTKDSEEKEEEREGREEKEEPSPLPSEPTVSDLFWQTAVKLVTRWGNKRGIYREIKIKPGKNDSPDDDDFYRPAARLVEECDGDGKRAWKLVEEKYNAMLSAGFTPTRLEPVVTQILADMDRSKAPVTANGNGNGRFQPAEQEPERVGGVY